MAVSSTTQTAAVGQPGASARKALHTVAQESPISPAFCSFYTQEQGEPSVYVPRWGAPIAAAAVAESAVAATPTTMPTVGSTTLTSAGYRASAGVTSEGYFRATSDNDILNYEEQLVQYAMEIYLGQDANVGVTYQYTQVTANDGNTGAKLTRAGILASAAKVWAALKSYSLHLACVIDGKGIADLADEVLSSGGTVFAGETMQAEVLALLAADNFDPQQHNYHMTLNGRVHVFSEASPDALVQSGGDRVGCVFLPALAALNGFGSVKQMQGSIMPAFGIVAKSDPISAARRAMANPPKVVEGMTGPIAIAYRNYNGVNEAIIDGWGSGGTGILNQAAACRVLYLA